MAEEQSTPAQTQATAPAGNPTKVQLDGKEYDMADLPREAQIAVQFMQRVDRELTNLRYELDKCARARNQALADLRQAVAKISETSSENEISQGIDVSDLVQ